MGLFGKKGPDRDELISQGIADAEADAAAANKKDEKEFNTGNEKVDMELTKVYAQLEGFAEVRKSNAERFTRLSEQLGEVRGMIVDTNKAMSKIEVAATKAVDLVESVHPEKLMIEVRKQDGKVEALRAQIESNEAIIKDLMAELKKVRDQMSFYKGMEQVVQLNDEVKGELASIKKMEAIIERHADKVETIFLEVEKKFTQLDKFDAIVNDVSAGMKRLEGEFDKVRVKIDQKEEKKEFVTLVDKFNDFEKHTTSLLKLLDDRSKTLKEGLEKDFAKLKRKLEKRLKTGEIDLEAPDEKEAKEPLGKQFRAAIGEMKSGVATPPAENAGSDAGADVAGGDVKAKTGLFSKLKRKIVSKPLDGNADGPAASGAPSEDLVPPEKPAEAVAPPKKQSEDDTRIIT